MYAFAEHGVPLVVTFVVYSVPLLFSPSLVVENLNVCVAFVLSDVSNL